MSFVIDLIIVAIILLSIVIGYRRGLLRCLKRIICFTGAFALSVVFFRALGAYLNRVFIHARVSTLVSSAIQAVAGSASVDEVVLNEPEALEGVLGTFQAKLADVQQAARDAVANKAADVGQAITESIANPLSERVACAVSFIIIFFATLLVLSLLFMLLGLLFRAPVLKQTNQLLGGALGVVLGIVVAWLFVCLLQLLVPYLSGAFPNVFTEGFQNQTVLYRLFSQYSFFSWFSIG